MCIYFVKFVYVYRSGPRTFLTGAKYVIDVLFALLMINVDYEEAKRKEEWLSKNFYY